MPAATHSETTRLLAEITDEGLFERLATAVLRQASPHLYSGLAHTGMNPQGKTVKSPIDGISYVLNVNPPHMVVAHHASGVVKDLRKKWLFDFSASSAPSRSGASPLGDVIKTLKIVQDERARTAALQVTLALTTNREPAEDLIRDVHATGHRNNVNIDIWSGSRIAHFLDTNPTGQWIRKTYLGVEATRLSGPLLHDLSLASLEAHPLPAEGELVERELDGRIGSQLWRPIGFVVAESGFGKTVACLKRLKAHVDGGGYGLVLTHEVLAQSRTLEEALNIELKRLHPNLEMNSASIALELGTPESPLRLVVEDINKSSQPALLIERLVSWQPPIPKDPKANELSVTWQLTCPIWPSLLALTSDEFRKHIDNSALYTSTFSSMEARQALRKRASVVHVALTDDDAEVLAESLGYDPLLIGLYDFTQKPPANKVIGEYIASSLKRLAAGQGQYMSTEYRDALRFLATAMLSHRNLDPTWADVKDWFAGELSHLAPLREVLKAGEVGRLSDRSQVDHIAFRHDRVRTWLLSDAVAETMSRAALSPDVLAEPFFAEVIGIAVDGLNLDENTVSKIVASNPLALFYALKTFQQPTSSSHHAIVTAMTKWLDTPTTKARANFTTRIQALQALAGTDSTLVPGLVGKFPDSTWSSIEARFRNGDIYGGISLCSSFEPGTNAPWIDKQIARAKARFGQKMLSDLDKLLREPELPEKMRRGALNLAGALSEPKLADAIVESWRIDEHQSGHIEEYLWAGAKCGGDTPERILGPACDSWAALSDQRENEQMPSPRESVAEHQLRWAFNKSLPKAALKFFIERSEAEDLKQLIIAMLRGIDDPDAVEYVFRYYGSYGRTVGWSDGFYMWMNILYINEWRRRQQDNHRPMSQESRQRLLNIWLAPDDDERYREFAFVIWEKTHHSSDLDILKSIPEGDRLHERAMKGRIARGDKTTIPWLIQKIESEQDSMWWTHAQHIWSPELSEALEKELEKRERVSERSWGKTYKSDWITSDLLMRISCVIAEPLLKKHWEHLKYNPQFLEAALYISSPELRVLVAAAFQSYPDKAEVFKHMSMEFGIKLYGHPGVTSVRQFEGVIPYLDYLHDVDIFQFWTHCNEKGWFEFRKRYLDGRLTDKWKTRYSMVEADIFASLDEELTHKHGGWTEHWIKNYTDQGESPENIIALVSKWVQARKSIPALEYFCKVLALIGRRSDLPLLTAIDLQTNQASEIVADTRIAIFSRSLT